MEQTESTFGLEFFLESTPDYAILRHVSSGEIIRHANEYEEKLFYALSILEQRAKELEEENKNLKNWGDIKDNKLTELIAENNKIYMKGLAFSEIIDELKNKVEALKKERELPDIYIGDLNTERINAYKKTAKGFNISESTVMHIFSKGADWYKSILKAPVEGGK